MGRISPLHCFLSPKQISVKPMRLDSRMPMQNLAEVSMWSVKFLSVTLTIRDSILFGPHIHPVTYNKTLVLEMPSPSFYCLSYWVLVWQDAVRKKKKKAMFQKRCRLYLILKQLKMNMQTLKALRSPKDVYWSDLYCLTF